jgi:DNA-directed RNA polymerase specialized sigma24 family protein
VTVRSRHAHPEDLRRLVAAAQRGGAAAFGALVDGIQGLALGLALGWLGDGGPARDVEPEAFLEAHRHLRDRRDPAPS